ncbi:D-tyrosyl-tRNA(Tyr) deacylase [Candidatus Woesebacteria bacterium RBG_16_36_11]|uniref:D-aminoacyl-tRNA deacylase n=3 Tax=Candidatus Woeseibacteriota TaxID=1752722 RepID=A0A1F7XBN3_9BACT|nr:MAG: D-tyrosyl-tRNA(Tyr) deacylase [Candidatus Woesebacteria bacterium RBG_13_36_22]OGM12373.1 MAG: D-tyrosyl-tRNA(Tyr) deacylase [Candidatus Woesebacteria bacterium RBG_16_36_11]OGM17208.1 MAG: D-tyrosyl-tRNA(Tyr) deacylase [Candidatus Woesebacteria bacterium RBG_19FT_COMBO_37_29]
MRLVIQRVNKASVERVTDSKIVGSINKGFFILVGVGKEDQLEDAKVLAEKVSKLRIMSDTEDKMNLSLKDVEGELLVVSQFTLFADTSRGNRPSFINAGLPEKAKEIYEYFVKNLKEQGLKVETGSFGDYMKINTELDGPVTIIIES